MVASTAASRTASVMSNSKPRGVIKRRGKPYKTEQHKVVAKKLKLNIEDSYQKTAKPGYTFLPFGTPDLADLCKELSRQRSLPMHNVHATPRHEHATNPAKVSHHTHRIGYHFRCQVVEDACERLGYVPYGGIFIAAADHAQKQYDSVIASAFAKQGVTYNGDQAKRNKESPEQIRAAIKELFPKIPQYDLDEVVAHAWDEKAMRVGRAKGLTLSQRVQYAVVARIRHTYTDYDTLLAAKLADWKTCRKEVEPFTLEKVFEWRGETDGDDEGLEEIVRETIVIDDDDDDDDDAPIVINSDDSSDTGYASDSSIEISYRPAAAEDLRAEEASGRDHASFRRRNSGRMHQRTDLARQMIHRHRNKEHNDRAYAYNQAGTYQHPPAGRVQRTYGASLSTVASPGQIIVGGQVMRLPPDTQSYAHPPGQYLQHDRPMQSIERGDHTYIQPPPPGSSPLPEVPPPPGLSSPAWRSTDIPPPPPPQSPPPPPPGPPPQAWHSHTAPQATRLAQPNYHGAGLVQDFSGYAQPSHAFPLDQYDRRQAYPQAQLGGNGMDFTPSPRRVYDERLLARSEVIRVIASGDGRYFEAPTQSGWRQREQIPSEHAYRPAQPTVQYTYSAPGAYLAPAPATAAPPRTYTQPVHGAPAPVQQMPRELAQPRPARLARYDHVAADPYRQSVYGAPQHAQYYPR